MSEAEVNAYLNGLLEKFNADPNHPELSVTERVLLSKVRDIRKGIADVEAEVKKLQEEVTERQQKVANLTSQLVYNQGAAQGFVEALVSLRQV